MKIDKSVIGGNMTLLILGLIENKDMYGYEMIDELRKRSDDTFDLKAGTLYPLLHGLEQKDMIFSYEEEAESGRKRKYYGITKNGRKLLKDKKKEWKEYSNAVNKVIGGFKIEGAY